MSILDIYYICQPVTVHIQQHLFCFAVGLGEIIVTSRTQIGIPYTLAKTNCEHTTRRPTVAFRFIQGCISGVRIRQYSFFRSKDILNRRSVVVKTGSCIELVTIA